MKRCNICGKKSIFLKLNDNLVCKDCERLDKIKTLERETQEKLSVLESQFDELKQKETKLKNLLDEYKSQKSKYLNSFIDEANEVLDLDIKSKKKDLQELLAVFHERESELHYFYSKLDKLNANIEFNKTKIEKLKNLYESLQSALLNFGGLNSIAAQEYKELFEPSVKLNLHYLEIPELKKRFTQNKKDIDSLVQQYQNRYTTKSNKTIYQLMTMALEAELQNILVNLKFEKLKDGIEQVKSVTRKYLQIASDGNQSIVSTLVMFIGQIEHLYINAVEIEYEYYIKKEKIKEEQRTLREQLRQEAAERKALEEQKAQIEREESKYLVEIESLKQKYEEATTDMKESITDRIIEIEKQLNDMHEKKEEIYKLQHGKAGYVYIISNLGSFGDDIFKIGMTRRLDPQDRVDELGSASVPFPFDVHCFIFSNDAVGLENHLHTELNETRVNRVNYRKEFFKVSLDHLESIVNTYEPTAAFNRTMLAEQYRQSMSLEKSFVYKNDEDFYEDELDDTLVS